MSRIKWLTIISFSIFLLTACSNSSSSEQSDKQMTPTEKNEIQEKENVKQTKKEENQKEEEAITADQNFNTYTNGRFGFSVKYPSHWPKGEEPDNGDGVNLYVGNPDIKIAVYGSHYIEGISDPFANINKPDFELQKIKTDSGIDASLIIGRENGKIIYEMVIIQDDIEYHLNAELTQDFFNENEENLLKVVKSFTIL